MLQLMRFKYEGMRCVKVNGDVAFDSELKLLPSMFADGAPTNGATYRLFATVTHLGVLLCRSFRRRARGETDLVLGSDACAWPCTCDILRWWAGKDTGGRRTRSCVLFLPMRGTEPHI